MATKSEYIYTLLGVAALHLYFITSRYPQGYNTLLHYYVAGITSNSARQTKPNLTN